MASESTTNGGARRSGGNVSQSRQTTNHPSDTAQFQTTFTFTGPLAITEAMTGNSVTANTGDMLSYKDFSAINVDDTDTLQITWKIVFA